MAKPGLPLDRVISDRFFVLSQDLMYVAGRDRRIVSVNPAFEAVLGWSIEDLEAMTFADLVHPDDVVAVDRAGAEIGDRRRPVNLINRFRKRDGTYQWFAWTTSTNPATGLTYAVGKDVTESKTLASAQDKVVKRLLAAAQARDEAAGRHVASVAVLCGRIAGVLGWPPQRVEELESAAAMHDLGKIAIPDSILLKPGALNAEERAVMQTHATVGEQMLSATGSDQAAEIAVTHHERFDGTGYPRGLSGEAIPISGRIAAAADAFAALTSDRVYRPAFTRTQALAMMRAESGTQFDPATIEALGEVLRLDPVTPGAVDVELPYSELRQMTDRAALEARRAAVADRARAAGDREHGAADRDGEAEDRDQAAAERDQASAGRDQAQADVDHQSFKRDRAAADRARAAGQRDRVAADRELAAVDAERRSADRRRAAADRDHRAPDRRHSQANRGFAAADRQQSEIEAEQRSADRHQAAADRDQAAADVEHATSDRRLAQAEARRRHSDRYQAAVDRQRATTDRKRATADRGLAEHDREHASDDRRRTRLDQLTVALGREPGMAALEREINRARHGNGQLVLAYVEVERIRQVGEGQAAYGIADVGPAAGAGYGQEVVGAIRRHLRSYDPILSLGDDEFVCALANMVSEDAERRFREIAATIEQTLPGASVSAGFAELRADDTLDQLTMRGDHALHVARHAG